MEKGVRAVAFELKFGIAKEHVAALLRVPAIRRTAADGIKRDRLSSVYYDTPKFTLKEHGLMLRVRRVGKRHLQTIKAIGESGVLARDEWEQEIDGDGPVRELAKQTALRPFATGRVWRKLKPLFEAKVERTSTTLHVNSSQIELAIDVGHIRAGRHRSPVSEFELELKDGDPQDLVRIAKRIARNVPLYYGVPMKPDVGYALKTGAEICAVTAEAIKLQSNWKVEEAFRVIGLSCLHQITANREAVRKGDSEGVHQMRVGLRRLRAAISVFDELVEGPQTEALKSELRWLTNQMGPARDLDVFIHETVEPLQATDLGNAKLAALKSDFVEQKSAGFGKALAAVESERYRCLILNILFWLLSGDWLTNTVGPSRALREQPIAKFAQNELRRRAKKVAKRADRLEELDARERHKLRIGVKKLRYATEFFVSVLNGPKSEDRRKRFLKALEKMQDALGKLNDISVHARLAHAITGNGKDKRRDESFAIGLVSGIEHDRIAPYIAAAAKAGRQLARLPPI
jgi:inorganic triphosphatase YgiF